MYRVLIAEDELLERIGLRYGVGWEKYDMTVAADVANGAEAWNEYQRIRPDLLVTDLKMPVMDGMTLIQRIRENDRRTKIVIISCVEDFATAREAISLGVSGYILKASMNMDEIETVIAQVYAELEKDGDSAPAASEQKEISMKPWLDGEMSARELAARTAERLDKRDWAEIQFCAVQPMTKDGMRPKEEFLTRAGNIMGGVLGEESAAQRLCSADGCILWAVGGAPGEVKKISEGVVEQLRDAMRNYLNLETAFGLSRVGGVQEAAALAESALASLKDTFFVGGDVAAPDRPEFREKVSGLFTMVSELMRGQAGAQASELFRRTLTADSSMYDSGERVRELANGLIGMVRLHAEQYEQAVQLEQACRAELANCLTIRAVGRVLVRYLREMAEQQKVRPQTASMSAALKYMHSHLCENPSLNEAAAQAGLSPSYFSACFRRETGMGFNEYLTRMRMEMACMLLTTTDKSIAVIAEELGYYDPSHFIRVFKKSTGVSPRQYRMTNRR